MILGFNEECTPRGWTVCELIWGFWSEERELKYEWWDWEGDRVYADCGKQWEIERIEQQLSERECEWESRNLIGQRSWEERESKSKNYWQSKLNIVSPLPKCKLWNIVESTGCKHGTVDNSISEDGASGEQVGDIEKIIVKNLFKI